ncbi:MAG: hypothetical protein ABJO75_11145 [Sedimentitalea sp.]|uniref:hypothetical protein n=2 Tax=Sedimentitalea sp. TaxID=2048915 RepID=UPI003263C2C7
MQLKTVDMNGVSVTTFPCVVVTNSGQKIVAEPDDFYGRGRFLVNLEELGATGLTGDNIEEIQTMDGEPIEVQWSKSGNGSLVNLSWNSFMFQVAKLRLTRSRQK